MTANRNLPRSFYETIHLERRKDGKPTVRAKKAAGNYQRLNAYYQQVSGVRKINARTHPTLYRYLRHEAGWTRKGFSTGDHNHHGARLIARMSEAEESIHDRIRRYEWTGIMEEAFDQADRGIL